MRRLWTEAPLEIYFARKVGNRIKQDDHLITFGDEDSEGVQQPHNDPLIIIVVIANFLTRRVLIGSKSSANVLYLHGFQHLNSGLDRLRPFKSPRIGFSGEQIHPKGMIALPLTLGESDK